MNELLLKAVREYCIETETFDRKFLSGPVGRDGVMPANAGERNISNKNALKCWKSKINEIGCTSIEFKRALIRYQCSRQYNEDMSKIGLTDE